MTLESNCYHLYFQLEFNFWSSWQCYCSLWRSWSFVQLSYWKEKLNYNKRCCTMGHLDFVNICSPYNLVYYIYYKTQLLQESHWMAWLFSFIIVAQNNARLKNMLVCHHPTRSYKKYVGQKIFWCFFMEKIFLVTNILS